MNRHLGFFFLALLLIMGCCHPSITYSAAYSWVDDDREDDDTRGQAAAVGTIYSPTGSVTFTDRLAADQDLYYAYADHRTLAGALVTWKHDGGALVVELLDASGSLIALSSAGDVVERRPGHIRLLKFNFGGYFYVRVENIHGTVVPYTIEVFARVFL